MARRCIDGARGSVVAAAAAAIVLAASGAAAQQCRGHVYLTLDTGNMSQAEEIAAILRRQDVRATFFLANERPRAATSPRSVVVCLLEGARRRGTRLRQPHVAARPPHCRRGGRRALPAAVRRRRRRDGHPHAGGVVRGTAPGRRGLRRACRPRPRRRLARAGRLHRRRRRSPRPRTAATRTCVGPRPDSSATNCRPRSTHRELLARALRDIRDGDVLMAHLGIWSRKDPYAPMLEPLITGLKERGLCLPHSARAPRLPGAGASRCATGRLRRGGTLAVDVRAAAARLRRRPLPAVRVRRAAAFCSPSAAPAGWRRLIRPPSGSCSASCRWRWLYAVLRPLEALYPAEQWGNRRGTGVDVV